MAFRAEDLRNLEEVLSACLGRFVEAPASIQLICTDGPRTTGRGRDGLVFRLPDERHAKMIRESWDEDRRTLPYSGIVFPEGSVLTVLFDCKSGSVPNILKPVADEIAIFNSAGNRIGYIEKYSYSFYPNSRKADEEIGYFRFDFHVDAMGEGDLGDHSHFHLHRTVDGGFRLPTGPVTEFDKIVSSLERVLAPEERERRHQRWFRAGKFKGLLMDLTAEGIRNLKGTLYPRTSQWNQFAFRQRYEEFIAEFA